MKRLTTEEWIKKAISVHGNKYNYINSTYTNSRNKITIICPEHGIFEQAPNSHINGFGCSACSQKKQHNNISFINKANEIHNNKYDYSKVVYVNNHVKVIITCPEHGDFEQNPHAHLSGKGCIKCGGANKSTTEQFIAKAKLIHGDKYDYSKVQYINNTNKVNIICSSHGLWSCTPVEHLRGCGCPGCSNNGFNRNKPAYLYYLKVTTNEGRELYKIGITNRTVNERFNLTDLAKIEIVKQKLYENGQDALDWETKLKRQFKEYQYTGPDILSSGNTELFTEDIIAMC